MTTRPPIRRWRIRNLKAVEKADLELAHLTVIVGANSSGKSTVLQSILLAVQAAQAETPGDVFPLNGLLAQLGEFKDAHSAFARQRSSSIGGVFTLGTQRSEVTAVDWAVSFTGGDRSQVGSSRLSDVRLHVGTETAAGKYSRRVAVAGKSPGRTRGAADPNLPLVSGRVAPGRRPSLRSSAFDQTVVRWGGTARQASEPALAIEGLSLTAGVPTHFLIEVDEHELMTERWVEQALVRTMVGRWDDLGEDGNPRSGGDPSFDEVLRFAVRDIRAALGARSDGSAWSERAGFQDLLRTRPGSPLARSLRDIFTDTEAAQRLRSGIRDALGEGRRVAEPQPIARGVTQGVIDLLARNVTYLGPLRQEPQVIYRSYSPAQPRNLGTRGEYTAPVMYRLRDARVLVPMPDGEGSREVTLQEAANAWLEHIGAATSLEVHDNGRLGYDVRVSQPGLSSTVDLTSVGVGVSQVVPVVLACLLADPGGVVLLEQPELHLHPAMQQRLADFFLALADSGRQLIVETHSEYLVTRLRLRVAQDRTNRVADHIGFINASKKGPRTVFTKVNVNRYGDLEEWPEGFFDQAAEDSQALLLEGLRKKSGD